MSNSTPYYNILKSNLPVFKEPDLNLETYKPSTLAEFHPLNNPHYPFAILAGSEDAYSSAEDVITWNEVGSAMIKEARKLRESIGNPSTSDVEVVALIPSRDALVYDTMILTILRSGFIPLLISPRSACPAMAHLIQASGAKHVYVDFDAQLDTSDLSKISASEKFDRQQIDGAIKLLPEGYRLDLHRMPTAFDLFPRLANGAPYAFNHDLASQMAEIPKTNHSEFVPVLMLHSSGTTGLPKLIPINRITFQSMLTATHYAQFSWTGELTAAMILPPFHLSGLFTSLYLPLARGVISGFFRPELDSQGRCVVKIASPVTIIQAMRSLGCTIAVFTPLTLADLAQERESVNVLRELKRVYFGGSQLSTEVGNFLHRQGVRLSAMYGATEVGIISLLHEDSSGPDWVYFEISPMIKANLVRQEEGGLYELFILSSDRHRCSITFEKDFGPQTYHVADLLEKHPSRPLYRVVGRIDDQIVLSNSEKTNPGPLETILVNDSAISAALVFGQGRPAVGVIIEPSASHLVDVKDSLAVKGFIDKIWPSIEASNRESPAHSRLTRGFILIIDPRLTPLPKTPKGTLMRAKILELMAQQIEQVYSAESSAEDDSNIKLFDTSGKVSDDLVLSTTKQLVDTVMGREVEEDKDLFLQGCDSVHAMSIQSRLGQIIKTAAQKPAKIPSNAVYQYPTVAKLAGLLSNMLSATRGIDKGDPCAPLHLMISKYCP